MSGVLVVGDVITDIIVMPDGPMVRGSDRRATIRSRPGGSGANQAVWFGALGAHVKFVSRVAAAELDSNAAYFRARKVEPVLIPDDTAPSGVLIAIVDADGERSFLTDRGANLNLCAEDLPLSLLDGIDLLMVSGYSFFTPGPRAAVMALLKAARDRGIATAIDPASVGFLREVGAEAFLKWTAGTGTIFANLDLLNAIQALSQLSYGPILSDVRAQAVGPPKRGCSLVERSRGRKGRNRPGRT